MTKILIVDDELLVLRSTAQLLSSLGFETAIAADPALVVETIRREHPDVVLQDVRMPGLDVEHLVGTIHADPQLAGTRIVLFSAGADLWELQEKVRAVGVLEKPFTPALAISTIENAMAQRYSLHYRTNAP